ncbi:MAG: DNA replication/repair protein RecF, partial [Nitrospinae bacterium]|nr:DNA replication/repair protein RecF [Nitrospinota bacterium]
MRLMALQMRNFRNFERVELACGPRLNIFVGDNGQGKTNILESIYVLAQLRSFRGVGHAELTRWGADVVSMKGLVEHPTHGEGLTLETAWDRQRRLLKVKGHEARRLVDYLGHLSALVFFPDSPQIVKGPPQERRRLVDRALVSLQPMYLSLLLRYQMVLKQRNRLLKGPKPDRPSLDAWNAKFVELGATVVRARARYILRLNHRLARLGELKLGDPAALCVLYQPALGQPGKAPSAASEGDEWANGADLAHRLSEGIAMVERDELRVRGSLVG